MYKCKKCGIEMQTVCLNWISGDTETPIIEKSDLKNHKYVYPYGVEVVCNCGHVQPATAYMELSLLELEDKE